jgi:hypothetical protein
MGIAIPFPREERYEFHVDLSHIHIDKKHTGLYAHRQNVV